MKYPLWLASMLACFTLNAAQPNIIFFMTDDQGYGDLSSWGADGYKTPNVDRLGAEGMKFTSFYVHNRCSPTRAAFMTGSKASRVSLGTVVYAHSYKGINSEEITTAEILKEAGYTTGIVGKWHLGEWPQFNPTLHGFDYFYGFMGKSIYRNNEVVIEKAQSKTHGIYTPDLTQEGVEFIKRNANSDKPFFLYYASPLPHVKWIPNEKFVGSSEHGTYGDVIQEIDWQVGELMKALEETGIADNTLFIFTSDNGAQLSVDGHGSSGPLKGGKWTHFEGGVRVPTVMRWPDKIEAGTETEEITAIVDMLPTFAEISGVKAPTDRILDGKSILPYMLGEEVSSPIHETFFTGSTIRYKDWKLYLKRVTPGGNGKGGMQGRTPIEEGSLFNLKDDIGETTDISSQHPEIVQELKKMAQDYQLELASNIRPPEWVDGWDAEKVKQYQKEMKAAKNNKKKKKK
ncbi:MAG: sulfatase-like hydrolase/transferase [Opitutales bacterium]